MRFREVQIVSEDTRNPDRHFQLKAWHVAVAIIVLLLGAAMLWFVVHRNDTQRRLQALRAAGYPTSFAELAQYTKLPEGVDNGAEVYISALAAYVPPVDEANMPVLGKAPWPARGTPLPGAMAQAISKCLAANQPCLSLLREAAGIEHCRYDHDYTQTVPLPVERKNCAQLLSVAALYHAYQGETDATMTCIRDGLRISDSLRREPALIGHLMRISFIRMTLEGLERSLSLATFTDRQLKDLDEMLTRTAGTLDLRQAMITERCSLIEMCQNPWRFAGPGSGLPFRKIPGLTDVCLADTLEYMEKRIEVCALPPTERLQPLRQIDHDIQRLSFLHLLTKILTPALTRVAELDLRRQAHVDMTRAALALERYRLATAQVPEQLAELVPQYLERVPLDPFDGQPIRYRRTNPGYLLYSIDTDGQDNGGRERDMVKKGEPYDLCFIVTR